MRKIVYLGLALALIGCASKHVGYEGSSISGNKNLKISTQRVEDFSDESNHFYSVTIENTGSEWFRVDDADLDFSDPENTNHRLVVGSDLKAWIASAEEKAALKAQNNQTVLDGIQWASLAVLVAGVAANDNNLIIAGGAGAVGSTAYQAGKQLFDNKDKAQTAKIVPESHLYSSFTVPSKGFLRKWFLVHTPKNKINSSAVLTLKSVEGEATTVKIPLVDPKKAPGVI